PLPCATTLDPYAYTPSLHDALPICSRREVRLQSEPGLESGDRRETQADSVATLALLPLGDSFQLLQMMNLMPGQLMEDPLDRQGAVLRVRQRRRQVRG